MQNKNLKTSVSRLLVAVGLLLGAGLCFAQPVEILQETDNIRFGKPGASDDEVIQVGKIANAHHMIAIAHGKVLTQGAPQDVMTPDTLARVFAVDADIVLDPRSGAPIVHPLRFASTRKSTRRALTPLSRTATQSTYILAVMPFSSAFQTSELHQNSLSRGGRWPSLVGQRDWSFVASLVPSRQHIRSRHHAVAAPALASVRALSAATRRDTHLHSNASRRRPRVRLSRF